MGDIPQEDTMNTNHTSASNNKIVNCIAKVIRIITVPPFMALCAFSLFLTCKDFYNSMWEYVAAVFFIAMLPMTAYPLQPIIPPFKHKGREGQRSLAFVMCNLGYVLSVVFALLFSAGKPVITMFLTYLLSGMTLLVVNKFFRFKASGHSCGLMGPAAALAYFIGPFTLIFTIPLFILALFSSVYLKRHNTSHFIVGGIIPVFWLVVIGAILL